MKKITLIVFSLMTMALVSNAQIYNGRFEDWTTTTQSTFTYDSLSGWMTTDFISQGNSTNHDHSAEREITNVHEGSSSIRLTSWTAGGILQGMPGAASNGQVMIQGFSASPVGGVPDNMRHAALSGYYQYTPGGSDHGSIETCLFKRNGATRDTIAYGAFDAAFLVGTYTHFTVSLLPLSTEDPDSSLIWLQSSPREPLASGVTGSVLRVDSLYYNGQIGMEDISPLVKVMLTYPVPAVNDINVKVDLVTPVSMRYEILDNNGSIAASGEMQSTTQKIDVSNLAAGNYFVNLHDLSGKKLCSDKFTIAR